jgi:hypothetical protein
MHGSEFYTHAPQRAHNPKGGQQKEPFLRNNPPTYATRHQPKTKSKPAVTRASFLTKTAWGSCKTSPSRP